MATKWLLVIQVYTQEKKNTWWPLGGPSQLWVKMTRWPPSGPWLFKVKMTWCSFGLQAKKRSKPPCGFETI
jgi:hypothetical protein